METLKTPSHKQHSPKQTSNKPTNTKAQKRREQRHKEYVPNVRKEQGLQNRKAKTVKTQITVRKILEFYSEESKGTYKGEEESNLSKKQ